VLFKLITLSEDNGETAKQQITTRSGRSFGVSGYGVNESSIDSHVGLSDLATNSESIVAEEDASSTLSQGSDSAGQNVGSPAPAELPVGGAVAYNSLGIGHCIIVLFVYVRDIVRIVYS